MFEYVIFFVLIKKQLILSGAMVILLIINCVSNMCYNLRKCIDYVTWNSNY